MRNFALNITTYNDNTLHYNHALSGVNRKVYTNRDYRLTIVCQNSMHSYTIEIAEIINVTDVVTLRYVNVNTRKGVYAVLTYFELLLHEDETEFLINQYGSLQRYFDGVCCTPEFIREKYNMRGE